MAGLPTYPDCPMRREAPVFTIDKEIVEAAGKEFRVLPLFEKYAYEHNYRKYYSLTTNELLKCRWQSYIEHLVDRKKEPYTFVGTRDFHFHNNMCKLKISENIHSKTDFRYKLGVGPGVDFLGQMPIPQDLYMKRGIQKTTTKAKLNPKTKTEDQNEIKKEKLKKNNN